MVAGWLVAILEGEPLGVAFAVRVAAVAIVEQMPKFVNEDVVEIEIAERGFGPFQSPHARPVF